MIVYSSTKQDLQNSGPAEDGRGRVFFVAALLFMSWSVTGFAVEPTNGTTMFFNIPQQRADLSLTQFAEQANLTLIFRFRSAKGKTANKLEGEYSVADAIRILLADTGLTPVFSDQGLLMSVSDEMSEPEGKDMKAENKGLVAFLASIFVAPGAAGQEPEDGARALALEEIIVTARKRDENLQDVPISVAAIRGRELQSLDLGVSSELQNHIANLTITGAFGSTNPQIFVRGVGNTDFNDNAGGTVGVYLDEVFLGAPAGKLLQMYDLEGVQLLRGPQGTLFGRNNNAGSMSFTSVKPGDALGGNISATVGSYAQADIEAAITIPISDSFSTRLAVNRRTSDGYGETRDASNSFVRDAGAIDQTAARLLLNWKTDNTDVLLNVNYSRARDDRLMSKSSGALPDGTDFFGWIDPDNDIRVNYSNYIEVENVDTEGVFLNVSHDFDSVTLTSITAKYEAERWATLDVDKSSLSSLHVRRNPVSEQFSQEFRLTSNNESSVQWVAGLYYFDDDLHVDNVFGFVSGPVVEPNLSQIYDSDTTTKAVFAEAIFELSDKVSLTAGARYTDDERNFLMNFEAFGLIDESRSRTDSFTSGRLVLSQKLNDSLMLYYSLSRGVQGGGYNGGAFSLDEIGDGYKPETLTAYEFGWKSDLAGGRLRLNGAVFYYDYTDIQVYSLAATAGGVAQFIINADKGELVGMDLEIKALLNNLEISAGLGLLDSEYKDDIQLNAFGGTFFGDGKEFVAAPEADFNLGLKYTVALGSRELVLSGDYSYRTDRYFDFTNRDVVSGGAYGLLNANLSYGSADGNWTASLWGKNLTDEEYVSFVADLSGNFGFYENFYGAPQTAGIRFDYRF